MTKKIILLLMNLYRRIMYIPYSLWKEGLGRFGLMVILLLLRINTPIDLLEFLERKQIK